MFQTFRQTGALLLGTSILFFGTGILYTLVVIRAKESGFSTQVIGIMQSSYQVGWLVAAMLIPFLIRSVGHIRVFATVAALGSAVILSHIVYVNELAWIIERLIMGICTAGLMVATESWLNDMSENRDRGKILAVYTILSWGAPVVGVWLLRFGDTSNNTFFILASVIISLGVIPILLTASRTPSLIETERFNIKKLYRITPLGVVGTFLAGLCHGGFFASVALYAADYGMTVREISNTFAIAMGVGVFMQWPIAMLSDKFDRRVILVVTSFFAAAPAIIFAFQGELSVQQIYVAVGLTSACLLGLYSQCIAHANDHLTSKQIVSAAGALVMLYGIGYAITPIVIGYLLAYSASSFFWVNGATALTMSAFVLYRMMRRDPVKEQGDLIAVSTASPYSTVITAAEEWESEVETSGNAAEEGEKLP